MIGQKNNLEFIEKLSNDNTPHFIIIVGGKGSGKTTLARIIADKLNATFSICGTKVDNIREVIDTAYGVRDKVLYCIQDGDTMRSEAKNAMLKITEEPPTNAYFILTVTDESTLLATIKSRAIVMFIEPYTESELKEYYKQNYTPADSDCDIVCSIATTPYEVDKIVEYGGDFLDYVELVLDNIAEVEPANAFKSAGRLALKTDEGYELVLFLNTIVSLCSLRIRRGDYKYAKGIIVTLEALKDAKRIGINRQQVYDKWVFNIREVL